MQVSQVRRAVLAFSFLVGCAHAPAAREPGTCDDNFDCRAGQLCLESHGRCIDTHVATPPEVPTHPPAPVAAAPAPADEPFKTYSGAVKFGAITVPLEWKVARAHVEDPEIMEVVGEIRSLQQQLAATPTGPARRALLDDLLAAVAHRRARLLALKENEASIVFALMILLESWKHPEFLDRPPRHTGLVATFPGTEQGGTVYCDGVAAAAGDGGAAPGLDAFKAKHACEARQLQAFMLVEAIADKGGVDGMDLCAVFAGQAGGSYEVLLDCMRDDAMRTTLAAASASETSRKPAPSGGKKRAKAGSPTPPVQGESSSSRACCRHCNHGKPCGDACIPHDRMCHVGPGCAC